jgi:hypothetical protein
MRVSLPVRVVGLLLCAVLFNDVSAAGTGSGAGCDCPVGVGSRCGLVVGNQDGVAFGGERFDDELGEVAIARDLCTP